VIRESEVIHMVSSLQNLLRKLSSIYFGYHTVKADNIYKQISKHKLSNRCQKKTYLLQNEISLLVQNAEDINLG